MNSEANTIQASWRQCLWLHEHQQWLHVERKALPHRRVVGYLRQAEGSEIFTNDMQQELIEQYCFEHEYTLVKIFKDRGSAPNRGLKEALAALKTADGLLSVDLERFAHDHKDRLRDLKPLLHRFFHTRDKYLLTILDGVNTSRCLGQQSALELLSSVKNFA